MAEIMWNGVRKRIMVVTIPPDQAGRPLKEGDILIVGRWNGPMVELTARRAILKGGEVIAEIPEDDDPTDSSIEIVGLVIFQARYTG